MISLPIYLFILIELIFVSIGDIKFNKIPNLYAIMNIIVFIILLIIAPEYYRLTIEMFLYSFGFLSIGFIFFLMRIMGGGDVKYLFSFFLLIPATMQDNAFIHLALSTIVIGGFIFLTNLIKHYDVIWRAMLLGDLKEVKYCFGTKFPFAPVILITWIWVGIEIRHLIIM